MNVRHPLNLILSSVACHIEITHSIYRLNQMTGFYFKLLTEIKWVNVGLNCKKISKCVCLVYITG